MASILELYQEQKQKVEAAAPGAKITQLSITGSWPPVFNPSDGYQREMLLRVQVPGDVQGLYDTYDFESLGHLSESQGDLTVKLEVLPCP